MAFTLLVDRLSLTLAATCFGARGGARPIDDDDDDAWALDVDEGEAFAVFLLGDDDEDGAFLARLRDDDTWSVAFRDPDEQQVALVGRETPWRVLLKLEPAGAPIVAAPSEDDDAPATALAIAAGPALWVTATQDHDTPGPFPIGHSK